MQVQESGLAGDNYGKVVRQRTVRDQFVFQLKQFFEEFQGACLLIGEISCDVIKQFVQQRATVAFKFHDVEVTFHQFHDVAGTNGF